MSASEFTDEDLMAYADGELAEDRAAALDLAIAEDAALAERLGLFLDTRQIAADALRPMLDEPVPDHLVQKVRDLAAAAADSPTPNVSEDNVVPFSSRSLSRPVWHLPVAASIALAIGLGAGLMMSNPTAQPPSLAIAEVVDPVLSEALSTLASGDRIDLADGAQIAAIATFRAEDNALCREFEYDHSNGTAFVSIACHTGENWQVSFTVAAAGTADGGYAPASSLEVLDAYLSVTNAGAPLTPVEETAALSGLP